MRFTWKLVPNSGFTVRPPDRYLQHAGVRLATVSCQENGRWYWYGGGTNSLHGETGGPRDWAELEDTKKACKAWIKDRAKTC